MWYLPEREAWGSLSPRAVILGWGMESAWAECFRRAGWLPDEDDGHWVGQWMRACRQSHSRGNLLLPLVETWHSASPHGDRRPFSGWLTTQLAAGAQLIPFASLAQSEPLGGRDTLSRWCFVPCALPRPWAGILSSRLSRRIERHANWFRAYRAACAALQADQATLITTPRTTADAYATAGARLFGLALGVLRLSPRGETMFRWLRRIRRTAKGSESDPTFDIHLSAPGFPPVTSAQSATKHRLGDEALCEVCDRLYVLHVRRGGNIERHLRAALYARPHELQAWVPRDPELVATSLAEELYELGAVPWTTTNLLVDEPTCQDAEQVACLPNGDRSERAIRNGPAWPAGSAGSADYLLHCTRAPAGPWPDEPDEAYRLELLRKTRPAARTPYDTLERIVAQRRLLAGHRGIRGSFPVVCFTAIPLDDLARYRVFRSHRGRWDFEPFGIGIRRDWLQQQGAAPVCYGDEASWQQLPPDQRPFFQLRYGVARQNDWSAEQEWRHVGNLCLDALPADSAFVFVPTTVAAHRLASISPWPVVILPP
ncbi:MAG: hypothetical protein AB7F89_10315 [Pirellulaceae bacterium]